MKKYTPILSVLALAAGLFASCGSKPDYDRKAVSEAADPFKSARTQGNPPPSPKDKLITRMQEILSDPAHPLMAASIGVIKDRKILFADTVGSKQPGIAATADTKFRIASISKLVTAIGVWQLIEKGLIDPEADASRYLDFELKNPHYPDTPITVRMLMAHTSSIRDAAGKPGSYNIPYGHPISAFFTEGSAYYSPTCWAPAEEAPGTFFAYCNMNYCLLGSIIERVSGERFDKYMTNHLFAPMGLTCSYNVSDMPEAVQAQVGTLYRKLNEAGESDPVNGVWLPQCDDFTNGYPHEDYADYIPGTNGSLFGPMGSLRISINELCSIMRMLCSDDSYNGIPLLKPETIKRMFTPVWTYDPLLKNGDTLHGLMNCYGMGPHIFTNSDRGDRIVVGQDLPFVGHTASAYGLLGGMLFDPVRGNGILYAAVGTGCDANQYPGKYSSFYGWEESLLTAAADFAQFEYENSI